MSISIAYRTSSTCSSARLLHPVPNQFIQLLQCQVAIDRIQSFFSEEEVPHATLQRRAEAIAKVTEDNDSEQGLKIVNGTFAWSSDKVSQSPGEGPSKPAGGFRLINIDITIPQDSVTVITGEVGCGKTALLIALLGEMRTLEGRVHTPRSHTLKDGLRNSVAYAAQTPWIESGVIKDIILFGTPYEKVRYETALRACCLDEDLLLFEDGDQTEIGEFPTFVLTLLS